jgi:ABC-type lipoprotein release transport system permease subunit
MNGLETIAIILFVCFLIITILIFFLGMLKPHIMIIALRYIKGHMRANLALMAAACVATAVITGSLIAGDSLERSITEAAYDNLGEVDLIVTSDNLFNISIAQKLLVDTTLTQEIDGLAPVIHVVGVVSNPDTGAKARRVNILGFDSQFFEFGDMFAPDGTTINSLPGDNAVYVNSALADEVGLYEGDNAEILFSDPGQILEAVFLSNPADTNLKVQLDVENIVKTEGLGRFQLSADRNAPLNVYLSLESMQKILGVEEQINTILVSNTGDEREGVNLCSRVTPILESSLDDAAGYKDAGLRLTQIDENNYLKLESEDVLFSYEYYELLEASTDIPELDYVSPVLTYFWNSLEFDNRSVPYSTVTAFDSQKDEPFGLFTLNGTTSQIPGSLAPNEIIINNWTAERLGAKEGDVVAMNYSVLDEFYNIRYLSTDFTVKYIVDIEGKAADSNLMPAFPGIEDKVSAFDWDPPFPLDLSLITDEDEYYWQGYKGTPKAFISLGKGAELWGTDIGDITQVRMRPSTGTSLDELENTVTQVLDDQTGMSEAAISVRSVKLDALASAEGIELFTEMFLAFSASCIVASAVLIMLLTTLRMDFRMSEIGILRALGFTKGTIGHIMLIEGTIILIVGGVLGTFLGLTFGFFLILGMNSFWSAIVEGSQVGFYASPYSLIAGFASGLIISILTLIAALRYLGKISIARVMRHLPVAEKEKANSALPVLVGIVGIGMLLSLALFDIAPESEFGLFVLGTGPLLLIIAARQFLRKISAAHIFGSVILMYTLLFIFLFIDSAPTVILFFMSGFMLLAGFLLLFYHGLMRSERVGNQPKTGSSWLFSFSKKNAARRPGRTMFTVFLFSFTLFILTSLTINIQGVVYDVERAVTDSGGGYDIMGDSVNPIFADLGNDASRSESGIETDVFDELEITQFKTRGDVGGTCSNLNRAASPRIVGANESFFDDNTFVFISHEKLSGGEDNPWTLLSEPAQNEVPAVGDYNTVVWILGLDLGSTISILDENDDTVTLKIVGIIENSIMQGSLIIWDEYFDTLYPKHPGYNLFLFRSQDDNLKTQITALESALDRYGFDGYTVESQVVANILVENTYIAVFQVILVFGLVIGTLGFGIVVSRNIMERQREIGILRAIGFKRGLVLKSLLLENSYVLTASMAMGTLSGVLASSVYLVKINADILTWPWLPIAGILAASFGIAILSALLPMKKFSKESVVESIRMYE